MSESAWNVLSSATFEQEKRAERRFQAVLKLAGLVENRMPLMQAMAKVVEFYANSEGEKISQGSLKRWWYKVKNHPQGNWLPLLLDRVERDCSSRFAEISENAWKFF